MRPGRRTAGVALLVLGVVVVTTACSGSRADKAGGSASTKPVVLTLATLGAPDPDSMDFVAAVERLSRGSIQIQVKNGWRANWIQNERLTAEDVRQGKVDLGVVGVRAWDTLGVKSFRALVAPLLVDSLGLERRVLASPLAERMLKGIERRGLVGLAIIPGRLRRPLGVSKALIGPADYRDAWIGIRPGGVAEATFRTLGAVPKGYNPGSIRHLVGAELDLTTIATNHYDKQARALTANVVLWPSATTVVMNREVFDALPKRQQDVLRRAGRDALASTVGRIATEEEGALRDICESGHLTFATAGPGDVAALRQAVRPVYRILDRERLTRELIAEIRNLREESPAAALGEPVRCPAAAGKASASAQELEGLWRQTLTRQELLDAGASPGFAATNYGVRTLELRQGRFDARRVDVGVVITGTYRVDGDVFRYTVESCQPSYICTPGLVGWARWSVYRDTLAFARIPGRPSDVEIGIKPLNRVR